MKKLRIAVVIPTHFDIHSSLINLLKVYRHIIKTKNAEVAIFTDKKNSASYEDFKIVKIDGIDYKTPLEKILFLLGIPRFYYRDIAEKLKDYDVIESSNPEFYGFAYQSYRAAKKYNKRLVYRTSQTVEGFYLFKLTKYLVVPIARKAYDYSKFLLFTNHQAEERCLRLGLIRDTKKNIIIGHATDIKCFRPMKNVNESDKTILLSVGGLYKIKGHHLIIRALKKIIDSGFDAELWIVGKGYYKNSLLELARKLGMDSKVKFLGTKNHEELAQIYNKSSIFVLANYQEITPAVNEALACGKPVVVMECGGREFVIPDESHGLVAKKFDVDDLSNKIKKLIVDKRLARKIAHNGRQHIIKNFSIEEVARKFYKACHGLDYQYEIQKYKTKEKI